MKRLKRISALCVFAAAISAATSAYLAVRYRHIGEDVGVGIFYAVVFLALAVIARFVERATPPPPK